MFIEINIWKNDIELLKAVSKETEASILNTMLEISQSIVKSYFTRIKASWEYENHRRPFSRLRVYKETKITLRYSFIKYDDHTISVMVKQPKSKELKRVHEKDIISKYQDECITQIINTDSLE